MAPPGGESVKAWSERLQWRPFVHGKSTISPTKFSLTSRTIYVMENTSKSLDSNEFKMAMHKGDAPV